MEDEEIASALKGLFNDLRNKEDKNLCPDSAPFWIQITDVYSVVDSKEANLPEFDRNFNNIKITDVSSLKIGTESEMIAGPRRTETPPDSASGDDGGGPHHMPIITEGFPEDLEPTSSSLITSSTDPVSERAGPRKSVIISRASLGEDTGDLSLQVSSTAPVKRKPGRPKGSRNKRKKGLALPCVSCSYLSEKSR